jgi:hypothetical protein
MVPLPDDLELRQTSDSLHDLQRVLAEQRPFAITSPPAGFTVMQPVIPQMATLTRNHQVGAAVVARGVIAVCHRERDPVCPTAALADRSIFIPAELASIPRTSESPGSHHSAPERTIETPQIAMNRHG